MVRNALNLLARKASSAVFQVSLLIIVSNLGYQPPAIGDRQSAVGQAFCRVIPVVCRWPSADGQLLYSHAV
jgi:hypothetical protein